MLSAALSYGALNDSTSALAFAVLITLAVAVAVVVLARRGTIATRIAIVIAAAWLIFFLPDVQYYAGTRHVSADSLVEPLERQHYVRAYILVFTPVIFLLLSLVLGRRTI